MIQTLEVAGLSLSKLHPLSATVYNIAALFLYPLVFCMWCVTLCTNDETNGPFDVAGLHNMFAECLLYSHPEVFFSLVRLDQFGARIAPRAFN